MATHCRILAWRIPWTEEPGGLQCVGSQSRTRLKQVSKSNSMHMLEPSRMDKYRTASAWSLLGTGFPLDISELS